MRRPQIGYITPQEINGYDCKGHTIQDSGIRIFLNTQLAPSAKIS